MVEDICEVTDAIAQMGDSPISFSYAHHLLDLMRFMAVCVVKYKPFP